MGCGRSSIYCDECRNYSCNCADNNSLRAENARLRAELEALRPKPVTHVVYARTAELERLTEERYTDDDLKLTFLDGVLVGAEVIKK